MGAPLNPVPQVLRVFVEGMVSPPDSYKWGNVLHFKYTGSAPTAADCDQIALHVYNYYASDVLPEVSVATTLERVTVTDLTSVTSAEGSHAASTAGSLAGAPAAANAAVLIQYPANQRYKGGHPRSYVLAGVAASMSDAATWGTVFLTAIKSAWEGFLGDCLTIVEGGTTLSTVGYVRYRGKFLPNGGPPHYYLTTPIYTSFDQTMIAAQPEVASQRRRVGRRKS